MSAFGSGVLRTDWSEGWEDELVNTENVAVGGFVDGHRNERQFELHSLVSGSLLKLVDWNSGVNRFHAEGLGALSIEKSLVDLVTHQAVKSLGHVRENVQEQDLQDLTIGDHGSVDSGEGRVDRGKKRKGRGQVTERIVGTEIELRQQCAECTVERIRTNLIAWWFEEATI